MTTTTGMFEWANAVAGLVGAVFGAFVSVGVGVWKFRGFIEELETKMEAKIDASEEHRIGRLDLAESRVEKQLQDFEERTEANTQAMTRTFNSFEQQFRDTFMALRQKINDVELGSEKTFMSKVGFESFLNEYRADCRERREVWGSMMAKIDRLSENKS